MGRQVVWNVFLLLILSAGATSALAQQSATATLTGRIVDPQGAVVSGASAIATQQATGARRETTTNDEGLYVLSNLPPGDYELRFEAKGFKPRGSSSAVSLQVGQVVTLDVELEIGLS
ncbi:MAG: carboxypeptidase-like regulatory domain-containing protein, partial [Pyrinomonadaceae bacterium]